MRPKTIGIVGGAGPLAGAYLLERILLLSNRNYGCYRDADFPKVFLLSFPFSEMLGPNVEIGQVQKELKEALETLRKNGADILAIACNTLHAFLEKEEGEDLIHLPRVLAEEGMLSNDPLILCTSISAAFQAHRKFFPCVYPDALTQREVVFLLPNDEGKYYKDFPKDVEGMLRQDFGNELIRTEINISFKFYEYGPAARPYLEKGGKIDKQEIPSYFDDLCVNSVNPN